MNALIRLTMAFDSLVDDLSALVRELAVRQSNNSIGGFVILAPNHHWGEPTNEQKHRHLQLVRRYEQVFELLSAWLYDAPKGIKSDFEEADKAFRTWLELGLNWSITTNAERNDQALRASANALREIVAILGAGKRTQNVLVPDTNSLIREPDPTLYRGICALNEFEFLLLPTVLRELDNLKILHRNQDVREKAVKAITRIKGWRAQGSLLEGVVVDKTITVRAVHNEPDVAASLSWLDPMNADDRIIASILRLQGAGACQDSCRLFMQPTAVYSRLSRATL